MNLDPVNGHASRTYQLEMFERSMEGNKIVVMDTGSGKTHVYATTPPSERCLLLTLASAILRIRAELEKAASHKRVWFLAPGVELCRQQHGVIATALPAYKALLLTGDDNTDRWKDQRIWDSVLNKVHLVVCTHAILHDALGHGFVRMSDLALLVFDEAHHCAKNHPANSILQDFYHPAKALGGAEAVPHILGLSASLVMQSDLKSLPLIETSMDSECVTPLLNREDLLKCVHRPIVSRLQFDPGLDQSKQLPSKALSMLDRICVQHGLLTGQQQIDMGAQAIPAVSEHDRAIASLARKAQVICSSIGTWAADYFILGTIEILQSDHLSDPSVIFAYTADDQPALLAMLEPITNSARLADLEDPTSMTVSSQVDCLVQYLLAEGTEMLSGIAFVEQRVATTILCALLHRYAVTRGKLRCLPFVGASNKAHRKYGLAELVDLKAQKDTLAKFRSGEYNLVVATTALEEGIDVQVCNVVVCFELPKNLKSFIQRRGRARHQSSRLGMMLSVRDTKSKTAAQWEALEGELIKICQGNRDRLDLIEAAEGQKEHVDYSLSVAETDAYLTAQQTLSHLYHFCNKLPHRPYALSVPLFSYERLIADWSLEDLGSSRLFTATVTLPNSISASLRHAQGKGAWKTQRCARQDAAFQAYTQLYAAGLLNTHLLPLLQDWRVDDEDNDPEKIASIQAIPPQWSLWQDWAQHNTSGPEWQQILCAVTSGPSHTPAVRFVLMLPKALPGIPSLRLHWEAKDDLLLGFHPYGSQISPGAGELQLRAYASWQMYSAIRPRAFPQNNEFAFFMTPVLSHDDMSQWIEESKKDLNMDLQNQHMLQPGRSVLRVAPYYHQGYVFHRSLDVDGRPMVECRRPPRRRDFRLPIVAESCGEDLACTTQPESFYLEDCRYVSVPYDLARVGLCMPAIAQYIGEFAVAHQARSTVLKDVPFSSVEHVLSALCAPSANRPTNYQRHEFIGDCVLKYLVSCHLFLEYPEWPEGFLTMRRTHLICNTTLAEASMRVGLPRYIITQQELIRKWTPPTLTTPEDAKAQRELSSKTLADVVEALIGAAWLDSGVSTALACISLFLPSVPRSLAGLHFPTSANAQTVVRLANHDKVESFIGYTFVNAQLLVEALTHPSYIGHGNTDCYQRLEFLGDAVQDMLVVSHLSGHMDKLTQGRMTRIRHALVNADLLGYFCLSLRTVESSNNVVSDANYDPVLTTSTRELLLADMMRFHSTELGLAHAACKERYKEKADVISTALGTGRQHPWLMLLQLRSEKFYSDLVESIVGAIFIDSQGDLEPCLEFITRLGLTSYLDRLISEEIDVLHPKEHLQQLAGSASVKYKQTQTGKGLYECVVSIGEEELSRATDCGSRLEAIALAATNGVELLRSTAGVYSSS